MSVFYKLPVKEVVKETQHAVSVVFDIPETIQSEFSFIPGQYITIQKELDGTLLRRAYSICSSPNSKELRVGIKEVEKGFFSVYANNVLKVGDTLEVAAPEGKFLLNTTTSNAKNYIAFVAGSGITPVLSMIKSVLETEKNSSFVLVYGSKSSDQTMFKDEIDALATAADKQLKVHYVFSQKISDKALFGRINTKLVHDILKQEQQQIKFDEYFICGPEEMVEEVKGTLIKSGVAETLIKYELFTSTSAKKAIDKTLTGNSKLTVLLDDEENTIEMRKDEIILDVALAHKLDAPYSCQGGVCSSCLARVLEGEAVMDKNTILDADEIEEGLILTCQAHPVTATIKIDYDDV